MEITANRHAACVIWLTGLSGAGKSTVAKIVAQKLRSQNKPVEELDGDAIRSVFPQTGFTRSDRNEHIRRVAFLASRLEHHGVTVVVSLISPYEDSREFAKSLCKNFLEVYISTPLSICQSRDPKGLYKKFEQGLIKNMSGLDEPYEIPTGPDIIVDTTTFSAEQSACEILNVKKCQL